MTENQRQDEATLASGSWQTNPRDAALRVDDASAILDALPVAVTVYDAEARLRYLNRAGLAGADASLEEIVGKRDDEVFPANAVNEYRPYLERAFTTRQTTTGECTIRLSPRDGREASELVLSLTYTPLLGPEGELERIIAIAFDITKLRRLEREASQFKAVQASPGYAVVTTALNGTILNFNRGAENTYGFRADEVIGKHLTVLCAEQNQPAMRQLLERVAAGELVEHEVRRRHKHGGTLELLLMLSPVRNDQGQVIAVSELGRDISQRRELERRLLSARHLETVSRAVAGLAHDLNNALTVVGTYSGLIGKGALSAEQRRDLQMSERAARRGAGLVSQLIALHQGQSQRAPLVDLSGALREIQESLPRLFGDSPAISALPSKQRLLVRTDVTSAQQLILALVDYAAAVLPDGAPRLLLTDAAPARGSEPVVAGRICIRVDESTNPSALQGRAPAVDPGSAERLMRELVEELGGRLELELGPRAVRQISVLLPLAGPVIDVGRMGESEAAEPRVVLIAEDEPDIREAMRRVLSAAGFRVLEAGSGSEAEQVAREHGGPIHVMVSDQRMPGGDGLDAIARVRAVRPRLSAILVSGHPDAEVLPEDVQFLEKPFSNEDLTALVERAAAEFERSPSEAPPLDRPMVLIVDDDPAVRDSMVRLLAECQLGAHASSSGLHALQVLQEQRIDVVVADQLMPGMDGVQLLEVVRDRWPETARVLFTAYPSSDVVLRAVNLGGVHKVLIKSMHPLQIRNEIEASALEAARRRA